MPSRNLTLVGEPVNRVLGSAGTEGGAQMTPAPEAARFAAGGAGDLDSLETRIWAHVKHVCSPSHKGRISTLVKVTQRLHPFLQVVHKLLRCSLTHIDAACLGAM